MIKTKIQFPITKKIYDLKSGDKFLYNNGLYIILKDMGCYSFFHNCTITNIEDSYFPEGLNTLVTLVNLEISVIPLLTSVDVNYS
jgi:hypothetical protein